ncbi:unnamed protein product [Sphenostylis stenocarpa]|uniref:Uncharacterized protein n=1 Tax=Sphenostylis stenocarpa TaxID=92480 RepID=A0AA86SH42_9FABA|nr:unnamed protein product [Sphenostylis stenocarpa]
MDHNQSVINAMNMNGRMYKAYRSELGGSGSESGCLRTIVHVMHSSDVFFFQACKAQLVFADYYVRNPFLKCQVFSESGVAEFISAMAAGWNAQLIVETWSQGGPIATSVGLAVARSHTGGRHVCVVIDERARSEYKERMGEAGVAAEVMVGEAEEVMGGLVGVDFMVVDSRRKDFSRVLRLAKLSDKGAVLLCKNANSTSKGFKWRSLLAQGSSRRVVRSAFLPVGKGLDMAHVSASGGSSTRRRWIKHVDQRSGDVHFIRR